MVLTLRIGVTGHRSLRDESALATQVQRVLERIRELIPSSSSVELTFTIISPLAEGFDRLVVRELVKDPNARLEVPLPMPREEYLKDFETDESKHEFMSLLGRAEVVTELQQPGSRDEAYERAGRYVVDNSDVLIALWDGEPSRGQGGTAEIVAYARGRKRPLFWIRTNGEPQLKEELTGGIAATLSQ